MVFTGKGAGAWISKPEFIYLYTTMVFTGKEAGALTIYAIIYIYGYGFYRNSRIQKYSLS